MKTSRVFILACIINLFQIVTVIHAKISNNKPVVTELSNNAVIKRCERALCASREILITANIYVVELVTLKKNKNRVDILSEV